MKKILLIVIFSCLRIGVNAETYYGEYFKVDSIEGVEEDLVKVNEYKLYNTYKLEYVDVGYLEDNDIYVKDKTDFIYEEVINDTVSEYEEIIKVDIPVIYKKYIYFYELSSNFKIYEIEVLKNGEKIDFKMGYAQNYEVFDINNMLDGDYDTYFLNNYNKGFYMSIILDTTLNLNDIEVIMYTKKGEDMQFSFSKNGALINFNNNFDRKHIISFNDSNLKEVKYSYKNKNILYKYYKEEKIPTNNYVMSGDNLILEDHIEINEMYKRNKLVLKDDLVINSKDMNINDFIEYSSTEPIINCDIDINVNGIYKCNFLLEGLTLDKEIIVDILEEPEEFIEDEKIKDIDSINKDIIEDDSLLKDNKECEKNNNEHEITNDVIVDENIEYEEDILEEIIEKERVYEEINNTEKEELKVESDKQNISLKKDVKNTEKVNEVKIESKKETPKKEDIKLIEEQTIKENKTTTKNIKLKESERYNYKKIIKIGIVVLLIIINIFSIIKKKGK